MAEAELVELSEDFPRRGTLRGPKLAAAADHPLAAGAGMAVLRDGGSAADAAVAMGAAMVVVQPHYSHLGGDSFAITFEAGTGSIRALVSSGAAPQGASAEGYRDLGRIPETGALAVTVPGCVDGWWKLHREGGRLPWQRLFDDAIGLARDGFPASRGLARAWRLGRERVAPGDYAKKLFGSIADEGGQPVVQEDLSRTLETIASGGAAGFYEGHIARRCLETLRGLGASFEPGDWWGPARWEDTVSTLFAGLRVHTQPPPTQGFVLPLALALYERLLERRPGVAAPLLQREAIRLAFGKRLEFAGDPDFVDFDPWALLRDESLEAILGTEERVPALPAGGDTTYMLAVDDAGNAVSLIQSVFAPWGSGVMVPGTGILMNNRMLGFTLREGHPNVLAPGKRPMHTLHSYLVTLDAPELLPIARKMGEDPKPDELRVVGGTPGGHRQPQSNLQTLDALLRRRLDAQDALDEPRWSMSGGGPMGDGVEVETREPDTLGDAFRGGGVEVTPFPAWDGRMGRTYVAVVEQAGLAVATDLRGEGVAFIG